MIDDLYEYGGINFPPYHSNTSIDTGFGLNNTAYVDACKKPEFKSCLFIENYLGEYKTEEDKKKVRDNLNVYSKQEIAKLISELNSDFKGTLVTEDDLNEAIANLDFVDSDLQTYSTYTIPNNLFKQ
jgi:hypothetical protein